MQKRGFAKLLLIPIALPAFGVAPRAATTPRATAELRELTADMTGIYRLAYVRNSNVAKETLTLVHQGQIKEIHTRTVESRSYLRRKVLKRPGGSVDLNPGTFDQLIRLAGGINRSVSSAPEATRQSFVRTAGLGGGPGAATTPLVVPSQDGRCSASYEPHATFSGARKHLECRLKAERPLRVGERLMAFWQGIDWIAAAHAMWTFKWTMKGLTSPFEWGFEWSDNWGGTGIAAWAVAGFGFEVGYFDMPGE